MVSAVRGSWGDRWFQHFAVRGSWGDRWFLQYYADSCVCRHSGYGTKISCRITHVTMLIQFLSEGLGHCSEPNSLDIGPGLYLSTNRLRAPAVLPFLERVNQATKIMFPDNTVLDGQELLRR